MVEAAKACGVKFIVYTSIIKGDKNESLLSAVINLQKKLLRKVALNILFAEIIGILKMMNYYGNYVERKEKFYMIL